MRKPALLATLVVASVVAACSAPASTPAPTITASAPPTLPSPSPTSPPATATPAALTTTSPVAVVTPEASSSPATSAAPSPTVPPSICEDTQQQGPGTRTVGTVKGEVSTGRILIGIEAAAGPSGTFALAYIDSSGLHEIATQPDFTLAHSVWATPDTVVFDSERAGDRHLFRMTIADGSVTQITSELRTAQQDAAIMPDGRIAHSQYSCGTPVDLGLHITAADGSTSTELTPARDAGDPGYDQQPTVSPDGKSIVFVRNVDDNTAALFIVPTSGGPATRLTADAAHVNYPRWSPDGKTILFTQYHSGGANELWTVAAAGGEPQQVTHSPAGAMSWEGDWSPDGSQIVYKYYEVGWHYNELHTASADGSDEQVLWTGDFSTAETPDWGP